ncbi:MAG: hypothetical protein K0Q76_4126 [Panacagrimonas sp.]|nr:hypothetical protein [Panacagrimonas sp.]
MAQIDAEAPQGATRWTVQQLQSACDGPDSARHPGASDPSPGRGRTTVHAGIGIGVPVQHVRKSLAMGAARDMVSHGAGRANALTRGTRPAVVAHRDSAAAAPASCCAAANEERAGSRPTTTNAGGVARDGDINLCAGDIIRSAEGFRTNAAAGRRAKRQRDSLLRRSPARSRATSSRPRADRCSRTMASRHSETSTADAPHQWPAQRSTEC